MTTKKDSDIGQTERILKLIKLLTESKYSVIALADLFGVGRQTIYRDIELLEGVGYFIDKKDGSYFLFEESRKTTFTEEETAMIQGCISEISDSNLLKMSIYKKLSSTSNLSPQADELKDKHLGTIIQKILEAIKNGYEIKLLNYQSLNSNEVKDRLVMPLALTENYSTLSALENEKEKTFKIKRMADVNVIYEVKESNAKPQEVDIFGFSSDDTFSIHLLLSQRVYQLFYEEYPQARVYLSKNANDASFPFQLKLQVHNYAGVGRWCLGMISELKVVGDDGLRAYLNEKLRVVGSF